MRWRSQASVGGRPDRDYGENHGDYSNKLKAKGNEIERDQEGLDDLVMTLHGSRVLLWEPADHSETFIVRKHHLTARRGPDSDSRVPNGARILGLQGCCSSAPRIVP